MSIDAAKYVSLTTFRRSGAGVAAAVWIAPLGDGRAGFTTGSTSGKVKRLGNDPRVTLQECSMRGNVVAGAAVVEATAEVVNGGEGYREVHRAIRRKYGIIVDLMGIPGRITKLFGKQPDECAVVIALPSPAAEI